MMQVLFTCSCWWWRRNTPVTQWTCEILWDNSHSQLLLCYAVCVCEREKEAETYLLTSHTAQGFIHLVIMQEPAGHHHTDRQMHWTCDRITWTVNIISISSCPRDAQHLIALLQWMCGWLVSTSMCVSVCVGLSVCRCVSVCQQWRLQDLNTWGYSQPGVDELQQAALRQRCKMLLYLSAHRCARPGLR